MFPYPHFFSFLIVNYLYLHQVLKSDFLSLYNIDLLRPVAYFMPNGHHYTHTIHHVLCFSMY